MHVRIGAIKHANLPKIDLSQLKIHTFNLTLQKHSTLTVIKRHLIIRDSDFSISKHLVTTN